MLNQSIESRCAAAHDLLTAGRRAEAKAQFKLINALDPSNASALEGLGLIALAEGEAHVARAHLEKVLQLAPGRDEARLNLADLLNRMGEPDAALAQVETVLAVRADFLPAWYLKGRIHWDQGRFDEAFDAFGKAQLDLTPDLLGMLEYDCHQRLGRADWRGYQAQVQFLRGRLRAGKDVFQPTFQMLTSSSQADVSRAFRTYAANHHPARPPLWRGETWRHDRIRIGFLTAEIYDHPVGNLMAGVLEHFDHEAFELIGFSYGPQKADPVRERIVRQLDQCFEVGHLDDAAIARGLRGRELDIAVTLNGYTHNARPDILAHRPAPVQVSYLGFPGTMGAPWIDYLFADRYVIPKRDQGLYDEKIVWMPDTYQPTDDRAPIAARTPSRAEEGLPDKAFVFMAYNAANKITPAMFDVWMRILNQVEDSVLWLAAGEPECPGNLRREACARGVDPRRLVFAARLPERAEHLARHRLADLFLDTLPYNAHSTASDALWAGLPVISCRGATFPGRVCAGLLTVAGLADLAVDSIADYERLAVSLATRPERLAQARERVQMAVRESPLFDTTRYVRHLESAFRTMHEIRQGGSAPRSFAVESHA